MAVTVKRITPWRADVDNQPGGLAPTPQPPARAGAAAKEGEAGAPKASRRGGGRGDPRGAAGGGARSLGARGGEAVRGGGGPARGGGRQRHVPGARARLGVAREPLA